MLKKIMLIMLVISSIYAQDTRTEVTYPKDLKAETLINMREHLVALNQIAIALSEEKIGRASSIAEKKLGLGSMGNDMGILMKYMPKGMMKMGHAMHQSADDFADLASVSDKQDIPDLLKAYSNITTKCIACHNTYKLK